MNEISSPDVNSAVHFFKCKQDHPWNSPSVISQRGKLHSLPRPYFITRPQDCGDTICNMRYVLLPSSIFHSGHSSVVSEGPFPGLTSARINALFFFPLVPQLRMLVDSEFPSHRIPDLLSFSPHRTKTNVCNNGNSTAFWTPDPLPLSTSSDCDFEFRSRQPGPFRAFIPAWPFESQMSLSLPVL